MQEQTHTQYKHTPRNIHKDTTTSHLPPPPPPTHLIRQLHLPRYQLLGNPLECIQPQWAQHLGQQWIKQPRCDPQRSIRKLAQQCWCVDPMLGAVGGDEDVLDRGAQGCQDGEGLLGGGHWVVDLCDGCGYDDDAFVSYMYKYMWQRHVQQQKEPITTPTSRLPSPRRATTARRPISTNPSALKSKGCTIPHRPSSYVSRVVGREKNGGSSDV